MKTYLPVRFYTLLFTIGLQSCGVDDVNDVDPFASQPGTAGIGSIGMFDFEHEKHFEAGYNIVSFVDADTFQIKHRSSRFPDLKDADSLHLIGWIKYDGQATNVKYGWIFENSDSNESQEFAFELNDIDFTSLPDSAYGFKMSFDQPGVYNTCYYVAFERANSISSLGGPVTHDRQTYCFRTGIH